MKSGTRGAEASGGVMTSGRSTRIGTADMPQLRKVALSPSMPQLRKVALSPSMPQLRKVALSPSVPQLRKVALSPRMPQLRKVALHPHMPQSRQEARASKARIRKRKGLEKNPPDP